MTPAHPLQRLTAFGIDVLLVLFPLGLGNWLAWLLGQRDAEAWLVRLFAEPLAPALIALALMLTIVLCWTRLQGTPGALLMGLQLVDPNAEPPGLGRALLRLLAYIPAVGVALIGVLWMLWDPQRRGWQDMLSGTRLRQEDEAYKSLRQLMAEAGA